MYFFYSILLSLGFVLMLPMFLLRREKYASGFQQRLGNYPEFTHDGRSVIWLHCVSVGETNAARPLVEQLRSAFPDHRLVISTTTKTGQELAEKIFAEKADAIFYFPFDFRFAVRRALANYKPSLVLLMETEIWPRFIREAKRSKAKVAIVNGRLSQKSFERYSRVRSFVKRVLADVDLALMQDDADAKRIIDLGIDANGVATTGNLKFEQQPAGNEDELTRYFRLRFGVNGERLLVIAASTHDPEESHVIESLEGELGQSCRLMIVPRHPERFDHVAKLMANNSTYKSVRRSDPPSNHDTEADIILLDSVGELRTAYPLADIVFVGGSLIPHGGQNVIEPAVEGKAIVTGPFTANFASTVTELLENHAICQTPMATDAVEISERLYQEFVQLIHYEQKRIELGANAAAVVGKSNRHATATTIEKLKALMDL